VTEHWSTREELAASLKAYTSLLAARNQALMRISAVSAEIKTTLAGSDTPDISHALQRRDSDIEHFSSLCSDGVSEESLLSAALAAANSASDELVELARSVMALREDSRLIAEEVLACQGECEALLKSRVEATSMALRRSNQRRRLDSAYGPALSHDVPTFMDKQQ